MKIEHLSCHFVLGKKCWEGKQFLSFFHILNLRVNETSLKAKKNEKQPKKYGELLFVGSNLQSILCVFAISEAEKLTFYWGLLYESICFLKSSSFCFKVPSILYGKRKEFLLKTSCEHDNKRGYVDYWGNWPFEISSGKSFCFTRISP